MIPQLTPIARCTQVAGLRAHELMLGVSPGAEHERILAMYRRVYEPASAQLRIVADIRDALDAGDAARAANLLIVLRRLLANEPVSSAKTPPMRRRGRPVRFRLAWPVTGAGGEAWPTDGKGQGQISGKVLAWRMRSGENLSSESVV